MENKEFYLDISETKIHCKLEFPEIEKEKYHLYIMVHGFTGNMEEDHIIGATQTLLQCGYAVLRVELFGHGKSSGEFKNHNMLLWLDELIKVIDIYKRKEWAKKISLIGHSQGALACILAGGFCREIIDSLILLSPATNLTDPEEVSKMGDSKCDMSSLPPEVLVKGVVWLSTSYIVAMRMMPVDDCIKSFNKEVFIVHGDEDTTVPIEYAYKVNEKYANSQLVVVEEADHCFRNHLELMLDAVKKFAEEHR